MSALRFAESHEWALVDDQGLVEVGISEFAQQSLGDVVYIELPKPGQSVTAGSACAVVESVKSASDIHAPLSGTVCEVNTALIDSPEQVNEAPYQSWLFKIQPSALSELDGLLSEADYLARV
ncbi:MAG: glycine cleavage system protein GcvH [Methylococcales bacterium]|nr:glycine cleavage system protein GcvH [Methylococcales bacterium]